MSNSLTLCVCRRFFLEQDQCKTFWSSNKTDEKIALKLNAWCGKSYQMKISSFVILSRIIYAVKSVHAADGIHVVMSGLATKKHSIEDFRSTQCVTRILKLVFLPIFFCLPPSLAALTLPFRCGSWTQGAESIELIVSLNHINSRTHTRVYAHVFTCIRQIDSYIYRFYMDFRQILAHIRSYVTQSVTRAKTYNSNLFIGFISFSVYFRRKKLY